MLEWLIEDNYVRAAVILVAVFALLKVVVFVTEKTILGVVLKTKTDIDDKLIRRSGKPASAIVFLLGVQVAVKELGLSKGVMLVFSRVIWTILIFLISYLIYVILDVIVNNWGRKWAARTESTLDDSLLNIFNKFLKIVFVIFGFLYALSYWGVEIGPLLAGLGIAGIAVAFALQNTLSNIFGGISLILDKSIKIGELVYLEDGVTKGEIMDIGLRSTKIRTFDNEIVIIPNGRMADMKIQNVVLPEEKSRVVVPFGVAYGSDVERVKKIVLEEVKKLKNLSKEPEPMVRFTEMADSALLFKAYFWVDSYRHRFEAIDIMNTSIYKAFNKKKIEIPYPQIDVHLKRK